MSRIVGYCPRCGSKIDLGTPMGADGLPVRGAERGPRAGDFSLCAFCGLGLRFKHLAGAALSVDMLTAADAVVLLESKGQAISLLAAALLNVAARKTEAEVGEVVSQIKADLLGKTDEICR